MRLANSRTRTSRFSAILATALVTTTAAVGVAGPASAEDRCGEYYENSGIRNTRFLHPSSSREGKAILKAAEGDSCGGSDFVVHDRGTLNGHKVVQIQQKRGAHRCLDEHAASAGGDAWFHDCNDGDYQKWEVFHTHGEIAFKSLGAWTKKSKHLCLAGAGTHDVVMKTCNVDSAYQRWV
ncbi:ricin-type beta-trefoil lectin domain protein [Krasilnikovia sp. M28-CT-15]|uniref:ricin-type beta-trefoil lectin domain protein n=1 Tax=Krasilnikovia sp. M28-CT-15 TaxID=3373540 RepID=UPI003875D246